MQIIKKITLPVLMLLAFVISASAQVNVTGSTGANATYATLNAAFTAINGAGTQAGNNILVEVSANTTEPGPAVLNSSNWTTLLVRPSVDGVTVAGPTTTGRGLVELNGADNVTIDGDNPITGGINRNLTFQNTAVNTIALTSVIRLAVLAATQTSANNNIVRNAILLGNATGRNSAGVTSTTGSENTTFGIYAGGNGGAAVPIALTSVTTNTAVAGTTIDLLTVNNNEINAVARGVVFNGAATSVSTGTTITNNLVGGSGTLVGAPPYTAPATTVYTKGMFVAGTNALTITGNTVRNILSYVGTTMVGIELNSAIGAGSITISNNSVNGVVNNGTSAARGIDISSASTASFTAAGNTVTNVQSVGSVTTTGFRFSTAATAGTFERNNVSGVNSRGINTLGAYGMSFEAGSNLTIRNNFISDVQHNMQGGAAFSTTFGVFGLRIAGGTGHSVHNNSVNLFAAYLGTPNSSLLSAAFAIVGTGQTGLDVRNNIFSNTTTGGTTSIAHVSVYLPTSGTSAMNLTMNNNNYFTGPTAGVHGVAHVGTAYTAVPAGPATFAGLYAIADFDPTMTTPTANFRAYTSTLSAAGTNDNASIKTNPLFASSTDLHLTGVSPAIDTGVTIGTIIDDIDLQVRPNPSTSIYDIGADEFYVAPGVLQLSSTTYGGNEGTTLVATVNRVSGSSGTVGVTYTLTDSGGTPATGGAACGVGVDYVNPGPTLLSFGDTVTSQPINVTLCTDAITDPAETFTITLSLPTGGATLGSPTVATATITDVPPPFSGTYTVGTAGSYPSLTNSGGIFEAINLAGASGPVTINIISDLTGETGTNALNEIVGSPTVLIKPSGGPRLITGSINGALIKINGADNVRIDGSTAASFAENLVGGNPALRELNIQNTNVGTANVVIAIQSGTNGAQNNTIQNVNVLGQNPLTTLLGISIGGNAPGTAGTDNDGNRIINCSVARAILGIYAAGQNAANPNTRTVIRENSLAATGTDRIRRIGVLVFNEDGIQIVENNIRGIETDESADAIGIGVGTQGIDTTTVLSGGVVNALVTRNRINSVNSNSAAGFSAVGIAVAGGTTGANTISNNFVSGVISFATSPDIPAGIFVAGVPGSTTSIYYNSVAMTGNRGTVTAQMPSFGIAITGTDPTVELKNNIFYTVQDAGTGGVNALSYAIGLNSTTFVNFDSNYNDFFIGGPNPGFYRTGSLAAAAGTSYGILAAWQTAVSDDANSLDINPLFTNPTFDLHLQSTSLVRNVGTPIAAVTVDNDNQPRPNPGDSLVVQVDIGGDEFYSPTAAGATISGRIMTGEGQGIRNATVMLSGGSLTQPIIVQTGSFGKYQFDNLPSGETYVLTVIAKRYTFATPSRVVVLNESVNDQDFISESDK